jgi:hypothetical protein
MPALSNNERIRQIADALEELNADVIYVGGAVIQLYSSDSAAVNPMTTYDVDCVVDITSYREFRNFEKKLYEKHFSNDTSEGAPICRYLFNGEKVDFMPKVDTGIGESNRWYLKGMEYRKAYHLDSKRIIYIMPVPYYLASKLEALHSRGGDDYRGEKDFEDIVFVLNSCLHLLDDVRESEEEEIRQYLKKEFSEITARSNIREEIECALPEEGRLSFVLERMTEIARI